MKHLKLYESFSTDALEELRSRGAEILPDGRVVVYHRTSADSAAIIQKTGKMLGLENGLFFSTKNDGQNVGYGEAVVTLYFPIKKLVIDDMFDDEVHVRLPLKSANELVSVAPYLRRDPLVRVPKPKIFITDSSELRGASELTQDLAAELLDNGAKVTSDGLVMVFFHTSLDSAALLLKTGSIPPREDALFSTSANGQLTTSAYIELLLPLNRLVLDDVYGDEAHVRFENDERQVGRYIKK